MVQIELKRRGLELKEAFNQTNRYERHSFWAGHGLFQFIQVFVISNGVNTKYYANNPIKARNFNQAYIELLKLAPTVNSVNQLESEDEELQFIKAFRELMRIKNVLFVFTEFSFDDLSMNEQSFEDYKSKYLDLYDKAISQHLKE